LAQLFLEFLEYVQKNLRAQIVHLFLMFPLWMHWLFLHFCMLCNAVFLFIIRDINKVRYIKGAIIKNYFSLYDFMIGEFNFNKEENKNGTFYFLLYYIPAMEPVILEFIFGFFRTCWFWLLLKIYGHKIIGICS